MVNTVDKTVAVAILGDAHLVPLPSAILQIRDTKSVAQEGVSTKTTDDAGDPMASRQARIKAISDVQTAGMFCQVELAGVTHWSRTGWVRGSSILCIGRFAQKTVPVVCIITDARPINQNLALEHELSSQLFQL